MVITKTPFRMSFFGGGTDYKEFYEKYGGSVISTTFDKYCYVSARHLPAFFDYTYEATYSKVERIQHIDNMEHPAIRETIKYLDMRDLHLSYDADLPARTGLGSSSSFVVGMLNAFYAIKGKYIDKKRLAEEAIYIERVLCNEKGGIQDQIAASYGGFNRIDFNAEDFTVRPIVMDLNRMEQLNRNLMLFFTGFSRISSEIASEQQKVTSSKISELKEMLSVVEEADRVLIDKYSDINEFGRLLDYSWNIKRNLTSRITTDFIDDIYKRAKLGGALGGKLLGAGGGGFMLFYVPEDAKKGVREKLKDLQCIPFKFEREGTTIMYYLSENYKID